MLTRDQTVHLLQLAQARDNRTIGEVNVSSWQNDLADVEFADALDALNAHYRGSTEYLTAGLIRDRVKAVRARRLENADATFVCTADPDAPDFERQYREQLTAHRHAIAEGKPIDPPEIERGPRKAIDYDRKFRDCPGRRPRTKPARSIEAS